MEFGLHPGEMNEKACWRLSDKSADYIIEQARRRELKKPSFEKKMRSSQECLFSSQVQKCCLGACSSGWQRFTASLATAGAEIANPGDAHSERG